MRTKTSTALKKTAAALLVLCSVMSASCGNQNSEPADTQSGTEAASAPASSSDYPITLKVGYSTNEDDPRGVVLKEFKETVEKETNGDILIEIHPSGELGSDGELIKGIIDGNVDMTVSSAGNFAQYATRIGVSALPFLFSDFESAWKFIDSDIMQGINVELEPFNMHVLAYFDNGFRCVTTSTGPINTVEDMAGLNIRTPENQIVMETMSALSAHPQSFPFAELKDALRNGTFDAQENPIPVIYNNGLYEVQKYLSITNHSYDAMPLVIRNDIWQDISDEYKAVIQKAADEAENENRQMVKKQTEDLVDKLKEAGMEVNYPDLAPFKAATSGVMDVFADIYGKELIDEVKANSD